MNFLYSTFSRQRQEMQCSRLFDHLPDIVGIMFQTHEVVRRQQYNLSNVSELTFPKRRCFQMNDRGNT
jgi:hypothetical protein